MIKEATAPATILQRALTNASMTRPTASDLANYLARQMPIYGPISKEHAERLLLLHDARPTRDQIAQAIIVATNRRQVMRGHGGATLQRV